MRDRGEMETARAVLTGSFGQPLSTCFTSLSDTATFMGVGLYGGEDQPLDLATFRRVERDAGASPVAPAAAAPARPTAGASRGDCGGSAPYADFGNLVQVYPTLSTAFSQLAGDATYTQLKKPFLQTARKTYGRFS